MHDVETIINCLAQTPSILSGLIERTPKKHITERRVEGKWSIHEQVCHLVDAQKILSDRFKRFEIERNPWIKAHNPDGDQPEDYYAQMNMEEQLQMFPAIRKKLVDLLKGYDEEYWSLQGKHDAFEPYSTRILLMHSINVDYAHMWSIEQLGLTKPEFVNEILTIP